MQYYFSWVEGEAIFSPEIHAREDEKLFSLMIREEEGSVPFARISIENPYKKVTDTEACPKFSHCFIAVAQENGEVELLFKGRLVEFPTSLEGEVVSLGFIGLSPEREQNYQALLQDLKASPHHDPLFLPLSKREFPEVTDLLGTQPCHVFWNRTSDNVSLSHITQGSYHADVAGNYYRDSLRVKVASSPLEAIEVHLHSKWVQRFQGATNFDHLLQADLKKGVIETYSGSDLEKNWWRADQTFRPHGYRVMSSSLESLPSLDGSDAFSVSPQDPLLKRKRGPKSLLENKPAKVRFTRKSYRPSLKLGWRYIQPRHEEVVFTLENDFQPLSYKPSKKKVLNLSVYDLVAGEQLSHWGADIYYKRGERIEEQGVIYQAHRSHRSAVEFAQDNAEWKNLGAAQSYPLQEQRGTFFKTERGQQVVARALEMAKAHLCASSRCVEISFVCPLEQALSWSCDYTLWIEDDRLPGGRALGKVKNLTFEVQGETGRMRAYVTLACAIGRGNLAQDAPLRPEAETYGEPGLFEPDQAPVWSYREEGARGILFPAMLGASDLLREVSVSYDREEQRDLLREAQYPSSHNMAQSLKGKSTRVKLRLEDLRGRRLEKTTLHIEGLPKFSAPKHLNFGE